MEDKILQNILQHLEGMKRPELGNEEIKGLKKEYDEKIERLLKDQEMSLRAEMDRKLHEKDLELKKMIGEL